MIQVKWVAAILFIFIIGFILSGTYDQVWVELQLVNKYQSHN